jgi:4-diphosphocytidyl-2-C-methyl-D-erythritol kinase
MRLVVQTRTKVNVWLRVFPLREGHAFHELESLFLPVDFGDRLLIDAFPSSTPGLRLMSNRRDLLPQNSVHEAWQAFVNVLAHVPMHPTFWIDAYLEKHVPEQTGLGAGSGDAGEMLLLLNELHAFPFSNLQLRVLAHALGSDVPFFVESGPCIVRSTGETVEPLPSFFHLTCCIALPSFRIDTGVAYRALDDVMAAHGPSSAEPSVSMQAVMDALTAREPLHLPEALRLNAFDAVLGDNAVSFLAIRDVLLANGAIISDLSGSGSAVFGIYAERAAAEAAALDIRRLSEHVRTIVAQVL